MKRDEWIEKRAAYLVAHEGTGESTARALAVATADVHQRIKDTSDARMWPRPNLSTIFETRDASDIEEPMAE